HLDGGPYWAFPDLYVEPKEHLLVWASAKNRNTVSTDRTLIDRNADFQYLIPTEEIDDAWTHADFDASTWALGKPGFGFNNALNQTNVVIGTRSIFVRKTFRIADVGKIKGLFLDLDYQDGFVAYINGEEIARSNIIGTPPAYNALAASKRPATDDLPERSHVKDAASLLKGGDNVLAIQIHRAAPRPPSMSLVPVLSAVYSQATDEGAAASVQTPLPTYSPHTDFTISSEGETVYLLNPEGEIVHHVKSGSLVADVSLGITNAEQYKVAYFANPTPGDPNTEPGFSGINNDEVSFSHQGGISKPLELSLSGATAPAVVRFTTDASVPNENSPIYSQPIPISKTTVVRARVFRESYLPSPVYSRAYLLEEAAHDLPIVNIITDPKNLFDDDIGIFAFGHNYAKNAPYQGANFWRDWERPAHISIYESTGELGTAFNAGIKTFGSFSMGNPQLSVSVFARQQYGQDAINYPLFPSRPYSEYQAFVLRNSGGDFLNTNMRDVILTSLMEGTDLELQAYRSAATYINGKYWGLYNIREKVNEHFLAAKFDLDIENLNILEDKSDLVYGSGESYAELEDFITRNSLADDANYHQVAKRIDIENYILYNVAEIYFNNTDWPSNNVKYWQENGGKWRWILFDTDFGFGTFNKYDFLNNTLDFALEDKGPFWPNPPWSTLLFRKLTENMSFRHAFINRYADELNSRFLPARVVSHIDDITSPVQAEIVRHFKRWDGDLSDWHGALENMKLYAAERPKHARNHLKSTFNLKGFHTLTIMIKDANQGFVRVNDRLAVQHPEWQGDYFEGVPFTLEALARPGYTFSHWESSSLDQREAAQLTVDIQAPMEITPVFEADPDAQLPIVINEINYRSATELDTGDWIELYNPNDFAIDIGNWIVKDAADRQGFSIPLGTIMAPKSYWIVARDQERFTSFYPAQERVVGGFGFGFSADGDTVRLLDSSGSVQDEVTYDPKVALKDSDGANAITLELISPSLDNSLASSWMASELYGSPGRENSVSMEQKVRPN
nr:CotH kinase family protein [Gammaproteobacteria bacterium]